MRKKGVSTLKVAAAYIGTVVGAGFATGQEVLQFFNRFGASGLAGIIFTTIMFIVFGYLIMDLGKKLHVHSYLEIIKYSSGRKLGKIIDLIITVFLFGSFTAMIAGTGALFSQQFNLSPLLGNILMAVITAVTVLTGINGVINSISFVVPFLLTAVIGTSMFSIISSPPNIEAAASIGESRLITNWFMSAVLYVSYNIILSVAVLGPLGSEARDGRSVRNGAVLGGLGLGLGSVMIYLALSGNLYEVSNLEVPMIYVAGSIFPPVQTAYAAVLTAEVYTTAVGSLYGFVSRIANIREHPVQSRIVVAEVTIAALLASQFGFSNLVKYLYPVVGYCGIAFLICLIHTRYNGKKFTKFKDKI